jgi:hypothetical protein
MMIVEITGGMLRAARSLAGLSQQEVADRAAISLRASCFSRQSFALLAGA